MTPEELPRNIQEKIKHRISGTVRSVMNDFSQQNPSWKEAIHNLIVKTTEELKPVK